MPYTREELRIQNNPNTTDPNRSREIITNLLSKLHNDEELTMAESEFICPRLEIIHSSYTNQPLDPFNYPVCDDALFRSRYMLYFNNVNGWYKAYNWYGEIPLDKKAKDIQLINRHYDTWKNTIQITTHQDEILRNICTETRHHIKEIHRFCKQRFFGGNRRDYLEKSIILHSKYMYFLVIEYYQENDLITTMEVDGQNVRIDSFCFIHILFRHYFHVIKEYQVGKTYHEDLSIDYKNMPKELNRIISAYKSLENTHFDHQKIYFSLESNLYAIWFRRIRRNVNGGNIIEELRVQTFYPVKESREIMRVSQHFPVVRESEGFSFHLSK